jgi:phosphonate transport system substrate-binding protein
MRDTDQDLTSVIVVRSDSPVRALSDLKGKTVAVGAVDSPQATLIPLSYLREQGLRPGVDFEVKYRALDKAVDEEGFYDRAGRITVSNYRY